MREYPTLIKPPTADDARSPIENVLDITPLIDIGPDIFTNTRALWHPPGARGLYGGAIIAQCLSSAQNTVSENFTIHSMHCYFILPGNPEIPILYHVERVREGKSFATRSVQAQQRGKCIFNTILSFVRDGSGGQKQLRHGVKMPEVDSIEDVEDEMEGARNMGPFQSRRVKYSDNSLELHEKSLRRWIRAQGRISSKGGHQAHLSALAYMTDSFFIGTVARIHEVAGFVPSGEPTNGGYPLAEGSGRNVGHERINLTVRKPEMGMMVSLDHTIYFHSPRNFRADEWMLSETKSPWAGCGRGLVLQNIFSRDGKLIASCIQEGLLRLKQDEPDAQSKL